MVVLLQSVFDMVSGEQCPLIIVIFTLVIAAIFAPPRRRLQTLIDRRFIRKKYDAQQVLGPFALTAREDTDTGVLTSELMTVIQETLQPDVIHV